MKKFESILTVLSNILGWLSALCITLMMVHIFADVVLKYTLKLPIVGTAEIVAYYYMLAAVFLPLPLVELRNAGVSVTLLYDMIGRKTVRRILLFFAYVGQVTFFAILAYQSSFDALESLSKFEIVEGQTKLYIWPATFILPLGLGMAAIVSFFRIIQVVILPDWEERIE